MQRQVMMSVPTSRLSPLARPRMPLIRRWKSQKLKAKKPKKRATKRNLRPKTKMLRLKRTRVLKSMQVLAMRSC